MTDKAILKARLEALEDARLQLAMGKSRASVSYDGKSVSYTKADAGQIIGMIQEIKMQLGISGRRAFPVRFQ